MPSIGTESRNQHLNEETKILSADKILSYCLIIFQQNKKHLFVKMTITEINIFAILSRNIFLNKLR